MSDRKPIGELLDALGVTTGVTETDLVSQAVVLLLVVDEDGDERLSMAWSEPMSWVTRTGMLHHALADETKDTNAYQEGEDE